MGAQGNRHPGGGSRDPASGGGALVPRVNCGTSRPAKDSGCHPPACDQDLRRLRHRPERPSWCSRSVRSLAGSSLPLSCHPGLGQLPAGRRMPRDTGPDQGESSWTGGHEPRSVWRGTARAVRCAGYAHIPNSDQADEYAGRRAQRSLKPRCPVQRCGPYVIRPVRSYSLGLRMTFVQPSVRLSKFLYASGAFSSGRRCDTRNDGLARSA